MTTNTPQPAGDALPVPRNLSSERRRDDPRHRVFSIVTVLSLLATDCLALLAAFALAHELRDVTGLFGPGPASPTEMHLTLAGFAAVAVVGLFVLGGLYSGRRAVSRMDEAYRLFVRASLGAVVAIAAASLVFGGEFVYSRELAVYGWAFAVAGVIAGRFAHSAAVGALRARGVAADRLLIVGAGRTGEIVIDKIRRSPHLGYRVAGFVRHRPWPDGQAQSSLDGLPVLGMSDDLAAIVEENGIDEIIVALSGVAHEEILDVVFRVSDLPVAVRVYPDTFRLLTSDVLSISDLNGLPTVRMRTIGLRPVERAIKRAMDVLISVTALVLLSPLMLVVAALVKLTSPGPVFYVQERVSQDGRAFQVLKFRTMPVDAERSSGPVFTHKDDVRPTRVGRFMRRYSIDELPQFINVLLGEMSVVGPRPERPYFVEQFRQTIPAYAVRHHEKAGITGWAQVNGLRGDTSIEERTRYDLYYVENWSILFDLKIILKTLVHVFRRDNNAY